MQNSMQQMQPIDLLKNLGQNHLIEQINQYNQEDQQAFFTQLNLLNESMKNGLIGYKTKIQKLLEDPSKYFQIEPNFNLEIPHGEIIDFNNIDKLQKYESIGIEEIADTCFVLLAGGLGERLGYNGIKISLPIDLITMTSFLEYYLLFIKAYQQRLQQQLPFVIMTSDLTHEKTNEFLQNHQYFGLKEQIILLKQESVPAVIDKEGRFSQVPNRLLIETKPHGHGDIHHLLFKSGLVEKWKKMNKKWLFIFQDTNPLLFRSLPVGLGVSKENNLDINTINTKRRPKEQMGAYCRLSNQFKSIQINIEYNIFEDFIKTIGQEEIDQEGFSKFPGHTGNLIFKLESYKKVLDKTEGYVDEFVNPKYQDLSKEKFKSSVRMECIMSDIAKLYDNHDKVSFTQVDRKLCFTTLKNDFQTAKQKQINKLAPESAGSCESDFYQANLEFLRLCGVKFEKEMHPTDYNGLKLNLYPSIYLCPSFGTTLKELRYHIQGQVYISNRSTVIIKCSKVLTDIKMDGIYIIKDDGIQIILIICQEISQLPGTYIFESINIDDKNIHDFYKIRGYQIKLIN